MTALISGSMAYDNIMVFHDRFKEHILPDKIHILNVSFLVPDMRREFGGCAGNIAFNLKLLGGDGKILATVGTDFDPYQHWLENHDISTDYIKVIENSYTGQAFITTDLDDNQITAFHPGAMGFSHENSVSETENITLGIVSPDGADGMLLHAEEFAEAGIPFIFDLGQAMPLFDGEQLIKFIDQASYATFNDYEWEVTRDRTGMNETEVAEKLKALIITKGAEGAEIHSNGQVYDIPPVTASSIQDPTGCGDAFRAGLLYGIMNDMDWETTGRIASLMGTYKIECKGTQNHHFTMDEFNQRFKENFNREI
jgi:adenosine kinase